MKSILLSHKLFAFLHISLEVVNEYIATLKKYHRILIVQVEKNDLSQDLFPGAFLLV